MSEKLLTHWSAMELYYRIIAKAERKDFEVLRKEDFSNVRKRWTEKRTLKQIIDSKPDNVKKAYQEDLAKGSLSINTSPVLSEKIFGLETIESSREGEPKNPNFIYNFGSDLNLGRPVIITDVELKAVFDFIGGECLLFYSDIKPWGPNEHLMRFEGTRWCLYHYRDFKPSLHAKERTKGIIQSVISFRGFSRVELKNYNPHEDNTETYFGSYEVYDSNMMMLTMRMKGGLRNLRMFLSMGTLNELPKLCVGMYQNIDENRIFSGVVVMESEKAKRKGTLSPKFLNKDDEQQRSEVPDYILDVFIEANQNFMSVPRGITSKHSLFEWLSVRP